MHHFIINSLRYQNDNNKPDFKIVKELLCLMDILLQEEFIRYLMKKLLGFQTQLSGRKEDTTFSMMVQEKDGV